MPTVAAAKSTKSREKIAEIQRALSDMEYLSSGTLLKRMKVCGNPRCHCASDPAARHGRYFEWSYLKGGKLRHRLLGSDRRQATFLKSPQDPPPRLGPESPPPDLLHRALPLLQTGAHFPDPYASGKNAAWLPLTLRRLFAELPNAKTVEDFEALLPFSTVPI